MAGHSGIPQRGRPGQSQKAWYLPDSSHSGHPAHASQAHASGHRASCPGHHDSHAQAGSYGVLCRTKHVCASPLFASHLPVASAHSFVTGAPLAHVMQSVSPVGSSVKPHVAQVSWHSQLAIATPGSEKQVD